MTRYNLKSILKKVWHFIWEDDSIYSWIANIILAFLLIKFVVYPVLGLMLGTSHPIVAVVSNSMEHEIGFDDWWTSYGRFYEDINISKENFKSFTMKNGFNRGDIILLKGMLPKDIKIGHVVVFASGRPDPIIHRAVIKWYEDGIYYFQTKGDNNRISIRDYTLDETRVSQKQLIGVALFRVPYLGYVKILAVEGAQSLVKMITRR